MTVAMEARICRDPAALDQELCCWASREEAASFHLAQRTAAGKKQGVPSTRSEWGLRGGSTPLPPAGCSDFEPLALIKDIIIKQTAR
jgi:hypothetical protein